MHDSLEQLASLIDDGVNQIRYVGTINANAHAARSTLVFQFFVRCTSTCGDCEHNETADNDTPLYSELTYGLAGSERLRGEDYAGR